jgi:hypothetical protein
MPILRRALWFSFLVLAACSGSADPDRAFVVGAPKADALLPVPPAAQGSERDAGATGPRCDDGAITVSHACLPPALRAGVPLRIYAEDNGCYAGSCQGLTTTKSCTGTVEGRTITLKFEVRSCYESSPDKGLTCGSDCRPLGVECSVPSLGPGTYRVIGESTQWATQPPLDRQLVVTADAESDSCLASFGPELQKQLP